MDTSGMVGLGPHEGSNGKLCLGVDPCQGSSLSSPHLEGTYVDWVPIFQVGAYTRVAVACSEYGCLYSWIACSLWIPITPTLQYHYSILVRYVEFSQNRL